MDAHPARCIEAEEPLRKALAPLKEEGFVVVTKDGKYAGELTAELLASYGGLAPSTKAGSVARKGTCMPAPLQTELVLKKFAEGKLEGIAVVDGNQRVLGQAGKAQVLQELVERRPLHGTAAEAASPAYTLEENQTVAQAKRMMARNGWKAIVATQGRQATGKLTVVDVALKIRPHGGAPRRTRRVEEKVGVEQECLKDVMQPLQEEDYIDGNAPLSEAAERMLKRKASDPLLVVEGKKLKGILGFHNLLKAPQPALEARVDVSGLDEETKWFKESIQEEADKLLRKVGSEVRLQLRVKSLRKAARKEYEASGRLYASGKEVYAATPKMKKHRENWDLHLSVKEVLKALEKAWKRTSRR